MAHDDELLQIEAESAFIAEQQLGVDPGQLAQRLAGARAAAMGDRMADRYASAGTRMLADAAPTRLDTDLIDRLAAVGFQRDQLRKVRVHRGLKAHAAADALGARAFAMGDADIFFGQGEFNPATREGRAVIAHEIAHIAPPTTQGGMPASYSAASSTPVLNERKRGDEDAAGEEAHEERAREAEAMVYAQEDEGGASPTLAGGNMPNMEPRESPAPSFTAHHLEAKVMEIITKLERSQIERRGLF
ncbi:MAG: DUF4157 domain-containing protein [Myxococcales bacterium]|nr:DUF4157 domain-containing protein [Myxococcales bacterium]